MRTTFSGRKFSLFQTQDTLHLISDNNIVKNFFDNFHTKKLIKQRLIHAASGMQK